MLVLTFLGPQVVLILLIIGIVHDFDVESSGFRVEEQVAVYCSDKTKYIGHSSYYAQGQPLGGCNSGDNFFGVGMPHLNFLASLLRARRGWDSRGVILWMGWTLPGVKGRVLSTFEIAISLNHAVLVQKSLRTKGLSRQWSYKPQRRE